MVEKKVQKTKAQSDYLSDSKSSEDEVNLYLCTSQEERVYGTIKGSTQATQAALSHTRAQSNPMVERGLPKQPKIKRNFPKSRQPTNIHRLKTRKSHCDN